MGKILFVVSVIPMYRYTKHVFEAGETNFVLQQPARIEEKIIYFIARIVLQMEWLGLESKKYIPDFSIFL